MGSRNRTDTYGQAQPRKGICYACNEVGHWSKDCPNKTQPIRPQRSDLDVPVIQCPHGHGACAGRTSGSDKNRNRRYYDCPRKRSVNLAGFCGTGGCDFFEWCDETRLPESVPFCPCGAGRCSVRRDKAGPMAGRWSFSCRVQKGHGACSFFQWEDSQLNTETNLYANKQHVSPQLAGNNVDVPCAIDNKSGFRPLKRVKAEPSMAKHHTVVPYVQSVLPPIEINKNDEPLFTPIHIDKLQIVVTESSSSRSDLINACSVDLNSGSSRLSVNRTFQTSRPFLADIYPRRLEFSPDTAPRGTSTEVSGVSHLNDSDTGFGKQAMQVRTSDVGGEASMEEEEELDTLFSAIEYLLEKPENKDVHRLMETIECVSVALNQDWSVTI